MSNPPIIFLDSFMHYSSSQITQKWTSGSGTISNSGGRGGRGSLGLASQSVTLGLPSHSLWIVGFAIKPSGFLGTNEEVPQFRGTAALQGVGNGQLMWTGNNASTSAYLPVGSWTYVELRVFFSSTVGTVDVWFNDTNVLSATGQNTGGNPSSLQFDCSTGTTYSIGDLYIAGSDTSTDAPYGDNPVTVLLPTGNGNYSQWTNDAGNSTNNYSHVNLVPPVPATSFLSSATQGTKDSYAMGDLPANATSVIAVQTVLMADKSDAGPRAISPLIRTGTSDYIGAGSNLSTSPLFYEEVFMTNPVSGSGWTVSDVNGMEFGPDLST